MSRTQHTYLPDDVDFAQLRGAFDAPIAPSPRFAAQLKEELMAELTASDRIRPASIARSTRDKGQISRVQSLTATNWQGALMTAAAILTVLALSFASLRYVTNRVGDNDTHLSGITHYPLASATPEATPTSIVATPKNELNTSSGGFGGSDRSFNLGAAFPALASDASLLVDDDPEKLIGLSQVFGDTLLRNVHGNSQRTGYLEAIDLSTGETRWTVDTEANRGFSSDGFNVFFLTTPAAEVNLLSALDLETGEVVWTYTNYSQASQPGTDSGTLYADGMVYASFNLYSLTAVNSSSGEEVWNNNYAVQHIEFLETGYSTGPSFAVQGDELYAVWEAGVVESMNRRTGEVLWSTDLHDSEAFPKSVMGLMTDENAVYVSMYETDETVPIQQGMVAFGPPWITALDRHTGDQIWSTPKSASMSAYAHTDHSLVVGSNVGLVTIDKATGSSSPAPYSFESRGSNWLVASFGDAILLFDGNTLMRLDDRSPSMVVQTWQLSETTFSPTATPALDVMEFENTIGIQKWNDSLVVSTTNGQVWLIPPAEEANEINALETSTPIANLDSTLGGYGGADRTFNVGATLPSDSVMFESIVDFTDSPSDRAEGTYTRAQVIDGLLIRQFKPVAGAVGTLEAIDIQTQDVMWSIPMTTVAGFASDGSSLFVVDVSAGISTSMVALSLDTGAQLWSLPLELTTTGFLVESNPIYFDHFVYYSRGQQGIVAVNSATGDVAWTRSLPFELFAIEGRPIGALTENPPEDRPDGIAVDASGVYVVWANTGVQALDRETGDEMWTRTMSAYSTRGVGTSSISVSNDLVLVGIHRPEVSGEDPKSMITAFEKTEGLTIWQKVTDDFVGNLAIAGTTLVIPLANGTIDTYDIDVGIRLHRYTIGWNGTGPIGISSNDESFIATYWQDGSITVEIVPLKVFAQSGTWKFTSDSATSWEYIPEAHIVGNALVFPTLEDSLWILEPTGQGR